MAETKLNLPDVKAIESLTRYNCYWLGEHYGKDIGEKIAELTQDAIHDGLERNELLTGISLIISSTATIAK